MGATEQGNGTLVNELEELRARIALLEASRERWLDAGRRSAAQYAVSQLLSGAASLDEVMPRILQTVCERLGWEWGALWVVDSAAGVIRLKHFWHPPDLNVPSFTQASHREAFAPGVGLPGRVWESRQPAWIRNVVEDPNFPRARYADQEGLHAAFAFPILIASEVFGVMEFFSHEVREPDEELLAVFNAIGSQIGQFVERTQAEDELRESEARFRAILESALDAVITMDFRGVVTEFNPAAELMFGYRRADVIGRDLAEVVVPAHLRDRHYSGLARFLDTGHSDIIGQHVELSGMRADGSEFPAELAIVATQEAGRPAFVGYVRDISARRHAEEQARFLDEAGGLLSGSLDYEQTLASIARLAVPLFADWCIVDLVDERGRSQRLAAAHAAPAREALLNEMIRSYPPDPDGPHPVMEVIRTGQSRLFRDVPEWFWSEIARDDEHLRMLQVLQPRSGLTVPLVARGRALGAIEFIRSEPGWTFEHADQALGEELARRAAVAVDNARLHHATQEALRQSAEVLAQLETIFDAAPIGFAFLDRDLRFVRINDYLASVNGRSPEDHVGRTVGEILPSGAGEIESLLRSVIETGQPVLSQELSAESAGSPGDLRHWLVSYYPVRTSSGDLVGVGVIVAEITERRRAEDRQRFLAEASRIISGSLDYEETLASIARLAVPFLADWCVVYLRQDGGSIHRLAIEHSAPSHEPFARLLQASVSINPEAEGGVPYVIRTGCAVLHPEASPELLSADVDEPERLVPIVAALGVRSWMCVPLTMHGRTFGAISFMTAESGRRYEASDLELAEDIARRAAVAVENARLYREAQDAIRAREQFLSIASHELKTPLTTVKASAQLIQRWVGDESVDRGRLVRLSQQLRGEIDRLEVLVSDLLDASRVQQGRLDLRPEPVDLAELARFAVERFTHAPERTEQHVLHIEADGPVVGIWDPSRLDQVITNLVSNAIKYSPAGGDVRVRVCRTDAEAIVSVVDQGIGLTPQEQQRLFQPFARGDVARQSISGTGLGLFITAQIVERHGGSIAVESRPGRGSTFTVRLPLTAAPVP